MKAICPRCGLVGTLNPKRIKGHTYYYVVHRINGKLKCCYIGKPSTLEVPIDWRNWLSIAPYFGGKKFVVPYLAKFIPPHRVYVEVFGGMACFLLNKPKSPIEIYNDIDGDLVRLFRTIRDKWEGIYERYKWLLPSRELFLEWQRKWVSGWRPEDDCEHAAIMIYLGGLIVKGFAGGTSMSTRAIVPGCVGVTSISDGRLMLDSHEKIYKWLRRLHSRLARVMIERLDYRECIRKYDGPETFFYLDPPYLKSMEKHKSEYAISGSWSYDDYRELKRVLDGVEGKWLMNHAENDFIEDLFNEYYILKVKVVRSTQTKRHGEKREYYTEMLIANYPLLETLKPGNPIELSKNELHKLRKNTKDNV